MYKTFADTNPLPKDSNLIDYGVEDTDLIHEGNSHNKSVHHHK